MNHSTLKNLRSVGLRLAAATVLCLSASAASADIVMRFSNITEGSSKLKTYSAATGWLASSSTIPETVSRPEKKGSSSR